MAGGGASPNSGPIHSDAYRQVKARLGELVEKLAGEGRVQLPPEDQLSAELGVSRPTIRSALLSLQKEGKIQRLHGRGTFINRYALRMPANVSEDRPFLELLHRLGYRPSLRTVSKRAVELPAEVVARLEIAEHAPGVAIERVFEADGRPAVFGVDYVAADLLAGEIADLDPGSSTFDFLESNTPHRVQYSVAELVPTVPPPAVAGHLDLAPGTPTLLLRHLHINALQRPIAVTESYVNDAIIRFSVVRTYLDS
jgi:GntR family transcriptional regulator